MEEYRALRAEIVFRLKVQQRLIEYGVILFAIFLTAAGYTAMANQVATENVVSLSTIVLAASLPFGLLLWAYQEQNVFVSFMGSYLNKSIKPTMEIGWEDFLSGQRRFIHDLVTHSRFVFLLVATATPVVTSSLMVLEYGQTFSGLGWLLLFANCALIFGALWLRVKTVKSFKSI